MSERILVTGGAGYLGSVLVPYLLEAGHKVTVIDHFSHGQNSLAACCSWRHFSVINRDCRDHHTIEREVDRADVVLPLAALVGAPMCERDVLAAQSTNVDAIRRIVHHMRPEQRIITPTTNSGYGIGRPGEVCTEESPLNPISAYGQTKVQAEKIVMQHRNATSLRLATVFGASPRMRIDLMVNDFVHRAVTDRSLVIFEGHFRRNFIHVRDVARAFLAAIVNTDHMAGQVYNVGLSNANLTKLQLAERIKLFLPEFHFVEAAIGEDPDKRDYEVSNAKIEALGFTPSYSLDDGIAELITLFTMLQTRRYANA